MQRRPSRWLPQNVCKCSNWLYEYTRDETAKNQFTSILRNSMDTLRLSRWSASTYERAFLVPLCSLHFRQTSSYLVFPPFDAHLFFLGRCERRVQFDIFLLHPAIRLSVATIFVEYKYGCMSAMHLMFTYVTQRTKNHLHHDDSGREDCLVSHPPSLSPAYLLSISSKREVASAIVCIAFPAASRSMRSDSSIKYRCKNLKICERTTAAEPLFFSPRTPGSGGVLAHNSTYCRENCICCSNSPWCESSRELC